MAAGFSCSRIARTCADRMPLCLIKHNNIFCLQLYVRFGRRLLCASLTMSTLYAWDYTTVYWQDITKKKQCKKNLFVTQYARFIKGLTRSSTKAHAQVTKREKNAKHQITKLACSCTSRWKKQKWRVSLECLYYYSHACVQRPPLGNGKVTVIYRVTAIYRSTLQKI